MLVRSDLSQAQQLVQAVHAAHEAGIRFGDPSSISSVVICSVPSEASLLLAKERADLAGIRTALFVEDDFGDQATAFATEPLHGSLRKVFRDYPLWGPQNVEA